MGRPETLSIQVKLETIRLYNRWSGSRTRRKVTVPITRNNRSGDSTSRTRSPSVARIGSRSEGRPSLNTIQTGATEPESSCLMKNQTGKGRRPGAFVWPRVRAPSIKDPSAKSGKSSLSTKTPSGASKRTYRLRAHRRGKETCSPP